MIPDPLPSDFALIRAAGSLIGAFLSLTYIRPQNLTDLFARGSFSIAFGFVFGFLVLEYLGWPETARHWMAASAAISGSSWLIAGAVVKIISRIDKWPFPK